jgi:hypothetical protein
LNRLFHHITQTWEPPLATVALIFVHDQSQFESDGPPDIATCDNASKPPMPG